ncbi:MAG: butyrate kinase [Bacteroidales bacterium]|jgi:butyrate kinase|nr:butyrate kinase [Bacteroidales bacterium]
MTKDKIKLLAINPGSTSTKVAVMEVDPAKGNQKEAIVCLMSKNIKHSAEAISAFKKIADQYDFRKQAVLNELQEQNINIDDMSCIIGRGGLIKPILSGIYEVNEAMVNDLKIGVAGQHASNLGGLIAKQIADKIGVKAYIADPVVVDEMEAIARITGHPDFVRTSIFHALNQKAIARTYAEQVQKKYEDLNLIVVHMGGGISVGVHKKGRVIDVNQALNGEGPFSPERSGTLPVNSLITACFSGKYTEEELNKMVVGKGGFVAYLGTNDALEVENRVKAGDETARFFESAMVYQIAKEIGAAATVLCGQIDAILLTGGMAYGKPFVEQIKERVQFLAKVAVFPGEDEMNALASNVWLMLRGEIDCQVYQ